MKNRLKIFLVIIFIMLLTVGAFAGYWAVADYYAERFCPNTWINGVYCTGKSVEEVNEELLSRIKAPIVIVTDARGKEYQLAMSDMNYQASYLNVLSEVMEVQKPNLWINHLHSETDFDLMPEVSYDKNLLKEAFYKLLPVKTALMREEDYYLEHSETQGYRLYDGLSHRLDAGKAFELLYSSVEQGSYGFSLGNADCYYDAPLSETQKETAELWKKLEAFLQCDIVYDMGAEQLPLTAKQMSDFLQAENGKPILDDSGSFVLDKQAVEGFVQALAADYDTYKKEREFLSSKGEIVTVKGVTYGTELNQKAEVTFLLENLLAKEWHTGVQQKHIPVYKREGFTRGKNDIGDTYIEIDMTAQKLYYYKDGERKVETDIVTGNVRRGFDTPEGVNYVYNKQENRVLRGKGYAAHVDFWMPVKGNIGIHDADWRDEFGGEIYKKNGSHGCINVPVETMPKLYEMVEIGTPVVMFY